MSLPFVGEALTCVVYCLSLEKMDTLAFNMCRAFETLSKWNLQGPGIKGALVVKSDQVIPSPVPVPRLWRGAQDRGGAGDEETCV